MMITVLTFGTFSECLPLGQASCRLLFCDSDKIPTAQIAMGREGAERLRDELNRLYPQEATNVSD